MKKLIIITSLLLLSCSGDDTGDCLQQANINYSEAKKILDANFYAKTKAQQDATFGSYQERLRQLGVQKNYEIANCY